MSKVTLTNLVNLQNETTAVNAVNANNATLTAALDNTLSRDGTSPNQMNATLDMNSNPIINLPVPANNFSPLRVIDRTTLNGAGTISVSPLPIGGTAGQYLAKNTSTNYDVNWYSPIIPSASTVFDTLALAQASALPFSVNNLTVVRILAGGPIAYAPYIRGTVSGPGSFQDSFGNYWQLDLTGSIIYASWFGPKADGVTDDYAPLQAFLNAIAANGAASSGGTIGVFPGGTCYVSAGYLTLTLNSSARAQNYRLIGYGTTILTDPTKVIGGLYIKRGTFLTHGDEQRGTVVEGLTIQHHNNANATYGIEVDEPNTILTRCTIYGGDDGIVHHQGNYAGIYYHQKDPQDEGTGPFWGRIDGCYIKGVGSGVSGIPFCIQVRGDCNRLMIHNNILGQGTYGILVGNSASSPSNNANAAFANGVTVTGNDFGALQIAIGFTTTLPSLSNIASWRIFDNSFESIAQSVVDLSPITQSSLYPNILGPNFVLSIGALITNPSSVAFVVKEEYMGKVTLSTGTIAANTSIVLGTCSLPGAPTTYPVSVTAQGNLQGCIVTGYMSAVGVATILLSNPTSGPLTSGSLVFRVQAMATN